MSVYVSKKFSTPEEFEAWIEKNEHSNKGFLDKLCEQDKENWDNKACKMSVKGGKLQLLCADGNVLAETEYFQPDNNTVCCEDGTGKLRIKGFENANEPNGEKFRVWVGTQAEYNAIRVKSPRTMYYITDDNTLNEITALIAAAEQRVNKRIDAIANGSLGAGHAATADRAYKADYATSAGTAAKATTADKASRVEMSSGYHQLDPSIVSITENGTYEFRVRIGERRFCAFLSRAAGERCQAPLYCTINSNGHLYSYFVCFETNGLVKVWREIIDVTLKESVTTDITSGGNYEDDDFNDLLVEVYYRRVF